MEFYAYFILQHFLALKISLDHISTACILLFPDPVWSNALEEMRHSEELNAPWNNSRTPIFTAMIPLAVHTSLDGSI